MSDDKRVPIRVTDKRAGPATGPADEPAPSNEPRPEDETVPSDETGPEHRGAARAIVPEATLEEQLAEAHRLAEERLDQLKRLKADFENSKQRMIREQTEIVERASRRIVERMLPVLDDFERSLHAAREHGGDDGIVRGVELVLKQLHDVLVSEGLERIDAEGRPFDPYEHEAMSSHAGEVDEPTVLEVVRPGYRLKGRTIRPALVRVSTPPEGGAEGGPEGDAASDEAPGGGEG